MTKDINIISGFLNFFPNVLWILLKNLHVANANVLNIKLPVNKQILIWPMYFWQSAVSFKVSLEMYFPDFWLSQNQLLIELLIGLGTEKRKASNY